MTGSSGYRTVAAFLMAAAVGLVPGARADSGADAPVIALAKTADAASVNVGTQIGYQLRVTNRTTRPLASVVLADRLPRKDGVAWRLASPVAGCAVALGTLGCTFDRLAAGSAVSVHVISSTSAASCGTISNTAYASAQRAATVSAGPVSISINCPPTVAVPAAADPNPVSGSATTLSVLCTDDGGEAALTYTWSASGPAPVSFSANGTNAAKNTAASLSQPGNYRLTATCRDAGGLAATSGIDVVSTLANQGPVVSAGPDLVVSLPACATLNGSVTDDGLPSGGTLTFGWSKVSGPGTVTFSNPNAASTTGCFSDPGVYVLRLSADDGELGASDDVTVQVSP
jgi:uncharacterized repeat protein (TIGR01451 family)